MSADSDLQVRVGSLEPSSWNTSLTSLSPVISQSPPLLAAPPVKSTVRFHTPSLQHPYSAAVGTISNLISADSASCIGARDMVFAFTFEAGAAVGAENNDAGWIRAMHTGVMGTVRR